MNDGWTCPECATANRASSVVCGNCGHVRPDLDRTQLFPAAPSQVQAAPVVPDDAARDSAAVAAAGGIPGWTPTGAPPEVVTPEAMAAEPAPLPESSTWGTAAEAPSSGGGPTATEWSAPPTAQLSDPSAIPGWSVAAPASLPLWRRIPLGWLIVGGFVLIGAVAGWYFNASRSSTGEISKAGDLQAVDLRVGDCFDLKDASADTIDNVRALPCTSEHQYELFFVGAMPGGDYPTDAAFEGYVSDNCTPAFASYIGTSFEVSALDVYWLQPTADSWKSGDRSVQCAVFDKAHDRLTRSLKGSQE
jgi:putative regulator of septum formation